MDYLDTINYLAKMLGQDSADIASAIECDGFTDADALMEEYANA